MVAAVSAVTAVAARDTPTETELLSRFAVFEEFEGGSSQEWIAGALGPLGALVHDGAGGGIRGY